MRTAEIAHLLKLEWQLDRRQKHAWGSMALYVVSTIYVCYQGVRHLFDIPIWNALFWIILLFAAFNALGRSFQRENTGRQLYLYTLASPRSVVLARTMQRYHHGRAEPLEPGGLRPLHRKLTGTCPT